MTHMKIAAAVIGAFALGVVMRPAASFAVTYFSTTRIVTGYTTVACPLGYRVTGGGADAPADVVTATSMRTYKIRYSHPTMTNGWTAQLDVTASTLGASGWSSITFGRSVTVYAVCVH